MSDFNNAVQTLRSVINDPLDAESKLGAIQNYKIPKGFITATPNSNFVVDGEEYFAVHYTPEELKVVTGKCPGVYNGVYNSNRAYLSGEVIRTNYLLVKLCFAQKAYTSVPEKFIFLARNVPTTYYKAQWELTGIAAEPPKAFSERDWPYTVTIEKGKLEVTFGGSSPARVIDSLKKEIKEVLEKSQENQETMIKLAHEVAGSYKEIASKVTDRLARGEESMTRMIKEAEIQMKAQSDLMEQMQQHRSALLDEFSSRLNDQAFYFKQSLGMVKDMAEMKMEEMKEGFAQALEGKFGGKGGTTATVSFDQPPFESDDGFPGKATAGLGNANYYEKAQDDLNAMKDTYEQGFKKPYKAEIAKPLPKVTMGKPVTIGEPMKTPTFKPKAISSGSENPFVKPKKSFKKKSTF